MKKGQFLFREGTWEKEKKKERKEKECDRKPKSKEFRIESHVVERE
jgi:hypothetical protein